MSLWVVMYMQKWDALQAIVLQLHCSIEHPRHMAGFLPIFDNYEAALNWANGDENDVVEVMYNDC